MPVQEDHIRNLFRKHIANTATVEEQRELSELAEQHTNDELAEILEPIADATAKDPSFDMEEWETIIHSIVQHPAEKRTIIRKMWGWKRWVAAASILLVFCLGSYFVFFNKKSAGVGPEVIVKTTDVPAPDKSKATITLADGSVIYLDSLNNGTIATQENVNVVKNANGEIVYSGNASEVVYNTMFNPRGSKVINLTLSDGTKVWLNSESSLKYPTAFAGTTRNVEITGEAYFEVAKDATKKFIVSGNGVITEVLGTHFNVNTYSDEASIKVTLLEGLVKVSKGTVTGLLKPGQQAQVTDQVKVVSGINTEEVMAWKNGKFEFRDASIETIMKQVSRWYNAEVVYEGKIPGHFVADISRDVPVSKLLHIIELTNKVHFEIVGNKIVVRP